ncbi:MAG TPA: SDR family oxidoreductase [Spirochaetota bacterium]|nr:SDR family oxidoreductase [Spirochaetota bacterium]
MGKDKKPVVLISGCSSGIGRAFSSEFSKRNFHVAATARKIDSIRDIKSDKTGIYILDVTDEKSIKSCVKKVIKDFGRIDVLVNNAGYGLIGPAAEIPLDDIRNQYETNLFGLIALSQAVIPHMQNQGSGRIINISSVSGVLTTPFGGAYCSSKAAVNSISDAMRMELAPFNIQVVTVQPGAIKSNFGNRASGTVKKYHRPGSKYLFAAGYIDMRAMDSQNNPTDAEVFVSAVVKKILKKNPPALVRVGRLTVKLPLLKWLLPYSLLDRILKKRYGLDKSTDVK